MAGQILAGMDRRTYTGDELRRAAAAAGCMTDLLRELQVDGTPGRRRHLTVRLRRAGIDMSPWTRSPRALFPREGLVEAVAEGIDTSHFTGQGRRRGEVSNRRAAAEDVLVVRPAGSLRVKPHLLKRLMLQAGRSYDCATCGLAPRWQGLDLVLVIDHVNGDWLDNRLSNRRFLCPNCHSQTATWCRRKGS